jgi:hypothetical protein
LSWRLQFVLDFLLVKKQAAVDQLDAKTFEFGTQKALNCDYNTTSDNTTTQRNSMDSSDSGSDDDTQPYTWMLPLFFLALVAYRRQPYP